MLQVRAQTPDGQYVHIPAEESLDVLLESDHIEQRFGQPQRPRGNRRRCSLDRHRARPNQTFARCAHRDVLQYPRFRDGTAGAIQLHMHMVAVPVLPAAHDERSGDARFVKAAERGPAATIDAKFWCEFASLGG
jgi:hypothetical protein